jgi:DNA-binding NarL/FixJ family response regulator
MCVKGREVLRVLVADQRRILRAGIKALLGEVNSWQPFEVDEAETTEEAMAKVGGGGYAAVLMEYGLPGRGGIKATQLILSRWPETRVLMLTDSDSGTLAERMIRAGARGCILPNVGLDTLVLAIRTVMAGRRFFSNEIAQRLLAGRIDLDADPLERLTARQREIFLLILKGLTDGQIAGRIGIAKRTVDKHRQHVNDKLGTRTPLELLQVGLRLGLLRGEE